DSPYAIIDLDHAIDLKTGKVKPWAQKIIDLLDSYTEISQSNEGLHIVIKGKKPGDKKCKRGDVEIYDDSDNRYIALTGNLLDGVHALIEDRQEQLSELYANTFDGDSKGTKDQVSKEASDYDISDLVFNRNASPPPDKFKRKLKSNVFTETWEYRRTDLNDTSLSGHAMALASQMKDCTDQEILDAIIAFYRKWGENKKAIDKPLRPEIIRGILAKIRHIDTKKGLPFEVKEVIQYGEQDAEYTIVTKSGQHIDMGETSAFLSPRRARQRLLERGYFLSPQAVKYWPQIIEALMPLIRIESLPSRLEETEEWLRHYLTSMGQILLIDPDNPELPDSLSKALTKWSVNAVMRDKQGRIYFSSSRVINSARMTFGVSLSLKSLAIRLKKIGFKPAGKPSDYSGGKRSQARMWMSDVGYLPPIVEDVELPAISSREGNFSSLREDIEAVEVIEAEDRAEEASQKLADRSAGIIRVGYEKP
ncbi:hypothetical protein ACFLXO_04805, partial [Chloroflexota bacterium]